MPRTLFFNHSWPEIASIFPPFRVWITYCEIIIFKWCRETNTDMMFSSQDEQINENESIIRQVFMCDPENKTWLWIWILLFTGNVLPFSFYRDINKYSFIYTLFIFNRSSWNIIQQWKKKKRTTDAGYIMFKPQKRLCQVKESRHKRLHIVWFHW